MKKQLLVLIIALFSFKTAIAQIALVNRSSGLKEQILTTTNTLVDGDKNALSPLLPASFIDDDPSSVIGNDYGANYSSYTYNNRSFIVRTRYRCNQDSRLIVELKNLGFLSVRHVTTITTNNFPYVSSSILPDKDNVISKTWIISSLSGGASAIVGGNLLYRAPPAFTKVEIHLQDSVFDLSGNLLDVIQDAYTSDIRCSYDPNDKHSSPEGTLSQHYTPKSSPLTYHINFQNTGNDTAYNISILDTLNTNLDLSTFVVLGSSHNMSTQMTTDGIVRFNFLNIMLPDSLADIEACRGWVTFKISPRSGLPDPTVITNTSYILFDLNSPVATNTTLNTMTSLQYPKASFTTIDQSICEADCINYDNESTFGTSYRWSFPGGTPSSSNTFASGIICYSTNGTYSVSLITINALGSDTLNQIAFVNVASTLGTFSVTQVGDSLIAPQGYSSYHWYFNSILIPEATSYFYVATQNGDYEVVVGNINGCQSGVNINNVMIGIDDVSESKSISIYPNPTSGSFELSFNSSDSRNVTIQIYDKVGQLVLSRIVSTISGTNTFSMDEKNLSAGVYTIQIAGKSKVISKLLMITK